MCEPGVPEKGEKKFTNKNTGHLMTACVKSQTHRKKVKKKTKDLEGNRTATVAGKKKTT